MANVKDFQQVDNDLYLSPITGDFVFVDSDNQHILDICQSYAGWWKNNPSVGAGVPSLLKSKVNPGSVESKIKQQLESDGYQVIRPVVTITPNGKFIIKPSATRINV